MSKRPLVTRGPKVNSSDKYEKPIVNVSQKKTKGSEQKYRYTVSMPDKNIKYTIKALISQDPSLGKTVAGAIIKLVDDRIASKSDSEQRQIHDIAEKYKNFDQMLGKY